MILAKYQIIAIITVRHFYVFLRNYVHLHLLSYPSFIKAPAGVGPLEAWSPMTL